MKNKKILIIGGSGFIGIHLASRLLDLDHDITIFCKDSNEKELDFSKKIKWIKGNIVDYGSVEKAVKNNDIIINLATVVQPRREFYPYMDLDVNCKGQLNVLEARKSINPTSKYIFVGTRAQFGNVKEKHLPIKEEHCQRPISLYGIHKQTAENYCRLYNRAFGLKSIILRLSIVYGFSIAGKNRNNIIDEFIHKTLKNEKFYVNGFGEDIKDMIYIDDVIDLLVNVIDSNIQEGIFNVGSGKKVKFIEIAKKIVELCGSGSFETREFPEEIAKFELGNFYFDISKVKKTFKWEPKINISKGLKKTIEFYKKVK